MTLFDQHIVRELRPLRGRQIPLIPAIAEAIKQGHKRIMVQAPTGYGKTVIAAHLMDRSARKGRRPMFVAPAIALVEQTLHSFESQGIRDIGIIQAQHHRTDFRAQVQIASRDTLVRRQLPEVDFVIVDEAHDTRESFTAILEGEAWKDKIVIGLSATPWSRGLGLHYSKLIVAATMRQMIDDGAPTGLSPFRVFAARYDPDMSNVKIVAGDYQESGAAAVMGDSQIIGDVVETWLKHRQNGDHPGDRTFLYGVHRAHAKSLMEAFRAQDVLFGYIDGETNGDERLRVLKRYRAGEDKGICNVGVLITGVDEDVRCIVDVGPNKSEERLVQKWGRGARLADGKSYCLALDHAGNCGRLGFPWDIHHDELDMRGPFDKNDPYEGEKPTPKPRKCGKCFSMIPVGTKACPSCGDVYVKPNDIEHDKGELLELTSVGKKKKSKKAEPTPFDKDNFYSELISVTDARGWKRGAADHIFKDKFGHFPTRKNGINPRPPSLTVMNYIRSRQIARAKSKESVSA